MSKIRVETDNQYLTRTIPPDNITYIISGSTTSAGILAYTHSLGVAPKGVFAAYYGSGNLGVAVKSITSTGIELYFFTGSNAANTYGVTASLFVKPY